jgi:hypothetical protein
MSAQGKAEQEFQQEYEKAMERIQHDAGWRRGVGAPVSYRPIWRP